MTVVEPQRGEGAGTPVSGAAPSLTGILDACPYLRSADGPWHQALPARGHRCARRPNGEPPTLDHQRGYCLDARHPECPIYADGPVPAGDPRGRFLPPTPVVLEQGSAPLRVPRADRRIAAPVIVILAGVVVAGLVLLRGPSAAGPAGTATPTPTGSGPLAVASASAGASSSPTGLSSPSPASSLSPARSPSAVPSPSPSPRASRSPTPRPSPSTSGRTYTVKNGDTLYDIAMANHTTTKVLASINKLKPPYTLHKGQVLKLP